MIKMAGPLIKTLYCRLTNIADSSVKGARIVLDKGRNQNGL